mmetsp:Transcript_28303/g.56522  ORF Transcript_28303/g.56522 Transcript_28303/m.56522 type:complete len:226 (-) Transcript_28303:5506-6183(-)
MPCSVVCSVQPGGRPRLGGGATTLLSELAKLVLLEARLEARLFKLEALLLRLFLTLFLLDDLLLGAGLVLLASLFLLSSSKSLSLLSKSSLLSSSLPCSSSSSSSWPPSSKSSSLSEPPPPPRLQQIFLHVWYISACLALTSFLASSCFLAASTMRNFDMSQKQKLVNLSLIPRLMSICISIPLILLSLSWMALRAAPCTNCREKVEATAAMKICRVPGPRKALT